MKVFYSWQSDTPRDVSKDFIREALDAAASSLQIAEADRPAIDQDTAGVLGSPVIAEAIFEKIQAASVIVADVTLTGQTPSGKRLTNSNVAIELGYAIGVHSDEVLLKVMNTHYGPPQDLPFDLTHRRWPVRFALKPGATAPDRQRVFDKLVGELREILESYIQANRPPPELFVPIPSTINAATYWQASEVLIQMGDQLSGDKAVPLGFRTDQPLIYMRIWPHEKIQSLASATLQNYNKSVIEPLCGTRSGWTHARNRYGQIAYEWHPDNTISSTTQVFKTGEIWGLSDYQLRARAGMPNFVPVLALERGLTNSLSKYLHAARTDFGYPTKIHLEFGMVNISGFRLALPGDSVNLSGEIFDDVKVTAIMDTQTPGSMEAALLVIFKAVYEAAGESRT
jgi:hypothetical protein